MHLELMALEYLAREEFSSVFELEEFVRLYGTNPTDAARFLAKWQHRRWVELVENVANLSPLLHVTEQAYLDNPSLTRIDEE